MPLKCSFIALVHSSLSYIASRWSTRGAPVLPGVTSQSGPLFFLLPLLRCLLRLFQTSRRDDSRWQGKFPAQNPPIGSYFVPICGSFLDILEECDLE